MNPERYDRFGAGLFLSSGLVILLVVLVNLDFLPFNLIFQKFKLSNQFCSMIYI